MKGHPSPLKCHGYYVTQLGLSANSQHDPQARVSLDFNDLVIEASAEEVPQENGAPLWRVALQVRQNVGPEKNAPYNFSIAMLGTFEVHQDCPSGKIRSLVEANGSALLYSSARQILREIMSSGPFRPLMLPTAHFVEAQPVPENRAVAEPKT